MNDATNSSAGLDAFRGTRVLVTGGAGFIGSHLVDRLLELGAHVTVLDNLSTGQIAFAKRSDVSDYHFVEGDLRSLEACRRAAEGSRYVFHQAARGSVPRSLEDPVGTFEVNLQGTIHMLEAAREVGVERTVFASSSSVYGDSEELPKREGSEGSPLSPYAASKRLGEQVAETFSRCYGQSSIGLRYFNVYGPRQDPAGPYAAVIPRFFQALLQSRPLTVYGDGEQSRDFTFVGDVVTANLLAAVAPPEASGRAYNIGGGHATTISALASAVAEVLDVSATIEHQPTRPGDVLHSHADVSDAARAIGYTPRTRLQEGLALSASYYRSITQN